MLFLHLNYVWISLIMVCVNSDVHLLLLVAKYKLT